MRCHEQFHVRTYQQSPQGDVYPLCAISSFCPLFDAGRSRKGGVILASPQVLGWDDYEPLRSHHYRSWGWGDYEPYRQKRQRANKGHELEQKPKFQEIVKGGMSRSLLN